MGFSTKVLEGERYFSLYAKLQIFKKMRNFKNYDIWSLSHLFVLEIYKETIKFPSSEKFGIISQMQRAAHSIPSNFSEGCGRGSDADFNRFIQIALGLAHEVEYFLILANDLKYISSEKSKSLTVRNQYY